MGINDYDHDELIEKIGERCDEGNIDLDCSIDSLIRTYIAASQPYRDKFTDGDMAKAFKLPMRTIASGTQIETERADYRADSSNLRAICGSMVEYCKLQPRPFTQDVASIADAAGRACETLADHDWIESGKVGKQRPMRAFQKMVDKVRKAAIAVRPMADADHKRCEYDYSDLFYRSMSIYDYASRIDHYIDHFIKSAEKLNEAAQTHIRNVGPVDPDSGSNYSLIVSFNPKHIERLGHYQNCDAGRSCFRRDGQYGGSPLALLDNAGTFIALLRDDSTDQFVGRGWGKFTRDHGGVIVQNVYPNTHGKLKDNVWSALDYVMGEVFGMGTGSCNGRIEDDEADRVYCNDDGQHWGAGPDTLYLTVPFDDREAIGECVWSGETIYDGDDYTSLDSYSDRLVLDRHLDNYTWSDYEDCYLDNDEAIELYNGEYVSRDHPDLRESTDGDWFIVAC